MRKIVILFLLFFLCQCSSIPSRIKKEQLKEIKRIGCISLLGDELEVIGRGLTIFDLSGNDLRFPDWKLNTLAIDEMKTLLSNGGEFIYIMVDYDSQQLNKIYTKTLNYPLSYDISLIQDDLRKLGNKYALDALVVLVKAPFVYFNMLMRGLGVYSRSAFGIRETDIYLLTRMVVFGGETMDPIANQNVFDIESLNNDLWSKNLKELTAQQQEILEEKIKELLRKQIPYQLRKVGLIQKSP